MTTNKDIQRAADELEKAAGRIMLAFTNREVMQQEFIDELDKALNKYLQVRNKKQLETSRHTYQADKAATSSRKM